MEGGPEDLQRLGREHEAVQRMLALLRDLSPHDPLVTSMPETVWKRLHETLASASVVPVHVSRHRAYRGGIGLSAAACVVLAGVLWQARAVPVPTTSGPTTATVAVQDSTTQMSTTATRTGQTPAGQMPTAGVHSMQALRSSAEPAASEASSTRATGVLGVPARRVLASGTAYRPGSVGTQVEALLRSIGLRTMAEVAAERQQVADLPMRSDGFTASLEALRSCVSALVGPGGQPALVIDRGTYEQADVGVIVAGHEGGDTDLVDIWLVRTSCAVDDPGVVLRISHRLRLPTR